MSSTSNTTNASNPIRIKLKARSNQYSIPSSPIKRAKPNPALTHHPLHFINSSGFLANSHIHNQSTTPLPPNQTKCKISHKSISIGPLTNLTQVPADFRDSTWAKLKTAIQAILHASPLPAGLEDLYRHCQTLCLHKHAHWLHTKISALFDHHATTLCDHLVSKLVSNGLTDTYRAEFVLHVISLWLEFTNALVLIRAVLLYLDCSYAVPNQKPVVWDLGVQSFSTRLLLHEWTNTSILDSVIESSIFLIRSFRGHISCSRTVDGSILDVIHKIADLFTATHHYTSHFEPALLTSSVTDYRHHALQFTRDIQHSADQHRAESYMHWVQQTLALEHQLADSALPQLSRTKLLDCVLREIVWEHRIQYLLPGVRAWMCLGSTDLLHTLFVYLVSVDQVVPDLTTHIQEWTRDMVVAVLNPTKDQHQVHSLIEHARPHAQSLGIVAHASLAKAPSSSKLANAQTIEDLLTVKVHIDRVVSQAFHLNSDAPLTPTDFVSAIIHAVSSGLVEALDACSEARPAEGLAKYVDLFMRSKRTATLSTTGTDRGSVVDHVMDLFYILKDKDTFLTFHKKHLARRLLSSSVTSDDAERTLVARLASERGVEISDPINKMFDNVAQSKQLRTEFRVSKMYLENPFEIELDVIVGQESVWPSELSPLAPLVSQPSTGAQFEQSNNSVRGSLLGANVHMPAELASVMSTYMQFYSSTHKGRVLRWQLELGTVVLRSTMYGKDLIGSMDKALVLLAYNTVPVSKAPASLSFHELQQCTGLDARILRVTLQSLACTPKVRILSKHASSSGNEQDDTYTALTELAAHHKSVRIKLPTLVPKEIEDLDAAITRDRVDTDRTGAVDAAIVRVMKTRKQVGHSTLFGLVGAQCAVHGFSIDVGMFKRRVSDLMDRDFLARTAPDGDVYVYIP